MSKLESMRFMLIIIFLALPSAAHAFGWNIQNDFSYKYTYRVFNNTNLSELQNSNDHLIRDTLNINLSQGNFNFEFHPEIRSLWSDGQAVSEEDPAFLTAKSPHRLFRLEHALRQEVNHSVFSDVERVYLTFQNNSMELTAGRSPLGIGVMKVLPIWNKFSPALINTAGSDLVFNPDLVNFKYQWQEVSFGLIDIESSQASDKIGLAQIIWYSPWVELQVIGGRWWERGAGGLAFVKDIGGWSVKGESLFLDASEVTERESQIGLGVEYAFTPKLSFLTEGLYESLGARGSNDYFHNKLSRFQNLLAERYWYFQFDYNWTDFIKSSLGPLINLSDQSSLWIGEVNYSVTSDIDIGFQCRVPIGGEAQEFGHMTIDPNEGLYIGFPQKYSLSLHYVF